MINKLKINKMNKLIVLAFALMLVFPMVSAGVGIKWSQESSLVPESTKTCLTYNVYNPWPTDSYVEISLSEPLMDIVSSTEKDIKFVPKHTSSAEAMPIDFCFKTPVIYERDCWIGDKLICKQECNEPMKTYEGEVIMSEVPAPQEISGTGGSSTSMSVSAPLRVRVQCVAHARNYSLIYIAVALIAAILLAINLLRKKKKKK